MVMQNYIQVFLSGAGHVKILSQCGLEKKKIFVQDISS